jgi:hypothetical protein
MYQAQRFGIKRCWRGYAARPCAAAYPCHFCFVIGALRYLLLEKSDKDSRSGARISSVALCAGSLCLVHFRRMRIFKAAALRHSKSGRLRMSSSFSTAYVHRRFHVSHFTFHISRFTFHVSRSSNRLPTKDYRLSTKLTLPAH